MQKHQSEIKPSPTAVIFEFPTNNKLHFNNIKKWPEMYSLQNIPKGV